MKNSYILGISAYYHDSSASLVCEDEIIAAAHEERFTRIKHDSSFPEKASKYCLEKAGIHVQQLSAVIFYEKPFLKFERIIKTSLGRWPFGFIQYMKALPVWIKQKLFLKREIAKKLGVSEDIIFFVPHHMAHAASSCFVSPFTESAVLTVDGVGELATTSIGIMKDGKLTLLKEIHFPNSLGLLYSTITGYLGFKVNSAEYKVMGLAPYGKDTYSSEMRKLITVFDDGSFELDASYFSFEGGLTMHSKKLDTLFGGPARHSNTHLMQREFNIACSLQALTEEVMLKLAKEAKRITGSKYLCLAGGVALNCVANGKIKDSGIFDDVFIQPASGDAGGSLGAALYYQSIKTSITPRPYFSPYLGPEFSDEYIEKFLREKEAIFIKYSEKDCIAETAKLIEGENVIGWFQGRAEFGPRALGNRSIIADPRVKENWQKVNLKIKYRESFRPFAPSVLAEHARQYFAFTGDDPYMLSTAQVIRTDIPAVTHVNNTARIQTVHKQDNPKYHSLIEAFYKRTRCPVVINTSFNIRSEPVVLTPEDAFQSFLYTEMDYLVLNNCILSKKENIHLVDTLKKQKYHNGFELD